MKSKNKGQKSSERRSENGVFWCFFVVFILIAGTTGWFVFSEVRGELTSFGFGVSDSELAKVKEATDKSVKSNADMIAKGREEQKTAVPGSKASADFDHLVISSNMVAVNKDFSRKMSKDECTKQYDRLKKIDDYTNKMSVAIARMEDEKRSKPLADAKRSLSDVRDKMTSFLSGVSDDSLPSDKKNLKSDMNNLLSQVDTVLQSDDIDQVNELVNDINSKKQEIQDAQEKKSAGDSQAKNSKSEKESEREVLSRNYRSFSEKIQALQNVPSIKSKGLKYVCELAGGEYEGTDTQGECYAK